MNNPHEKQKRPANHRRPKAPGTRLSGDFIHRHIPRNRVVHTFRKDARHQPAGVLPAILSPKAILLAALLRDSGFKALIIPFLLLNAPDQITLFHLARIDSHLCGYRPYLLNFHLFILPCVVIGVNV